MNNKLVLTMAIITSISLTVNVMTITGLLKLPPDWLVHDVRTLKERFNTHVEAHP